jgi:predicted nucleic acid-binding protein
VASALGRKQRTGLIDDVQRNRMWRAFVNHRRRQYQILALDERIFRLSERLIRRYPLRAADAIQVAGALLTQRTLSDSDEEFSFCTADRTQAAAARAEGLTVEFIA